MATPIPPVPDAEAWCLHLDLPADQAFTAADLYPVAYGVAESHEAPPEPMFWHEEDKAWWSLGPDPETPVRTLVWTVDLVALHDAPAETHRAHLEAVQAELTARAATIGAQVRVEESVSAALYRMPRVWSRAELRGAVVAIDVVPPEPASVRAWWEALEGAGMHLGDGDLFWIDADELGFPGAPFEISAEPKSSGAYFHPDDLEGDKKFPDVTLAYVVSEPPNPEAVLPALVNLAEQVAEPLGAKLMGPDGGPWSKDQALAVIERVLGALGPRR
ncbi:MAG: hypothetical protein H6730_28940 [Deltaproteobacteria bacterium]|nr:hypothetical protein [Deltaproteobacteria bacterium]